MSKLRFYKVEIKNGHGSSYSTVPAHSKGNAEDYFVNNNINAVADFIGFHEVDIRYDGSEMVFSGAGLTFDSQCVGYNYIYNQLTVSVNKFIIELQAKGLHA